MRHFNFVDLLPRTAVLVCLTLVVGCGGDDGTSTGTSAESGGQGNTVNADGTTNLGQHRQTIYNIQDESHKLIVIIAEGGIVPAASASKEQQDKFKEVASPYAFGEAKDAVLTYADWMENLDDNQAKELNAKLDALHTWLDEMQACYPFTAGGQLPQAKQHVETLEGYVKAIKADLPQ